MVITFGRYGLFVWPMWSWPIWSVADMVQTLLRWLQSVQNAAARLVAGSRRSDHITPVLRRLHWLPVRRRIEFKLALPYTSRWMVQHLATCLMTVSLSQMSAAIGFVHLCAGVPRTHTGFGDRPFQVAGPRLWNSLPASLRQPDTTVGQFKKLLKTHLFSWDCGALVTVVFTAPCINISTTTTTTRPTTYALAALVKLIRTLMHAVSGVFKSSVKTGEVP